MQKRVGIRSVARSRHREVIPPKTVIEFVGRGKRWNAFWRGLRGIRLRVGYYSRKDTLDTVWLVDRAGCYIATWDQESLLEDFKVVRRSYERDYFGVRKRRLPRLTGAGSRKG